MALINTTGVRLTSSRSSPGTLALHAARVSALWLTTSTEPGTSFASRRGRLRDQQFLRGEFLHREPAPLRHAPQQEHLYAGLRVHTIAGSVHARTPHGLLKEQSCTSELFKAIQDAVSLILLHRTMLLFRAASSSTFIMSDVQSICIPSSIRD